MKKGSITKSVIWQMAGKFLLQGIAFFTAPIFTRLLTTSDYGYTSLYASWVAILSLAVGLMTYGSIANARIKLKSEELNGYLSSIMSISVISFIIILTISIVFRETLANLCGIKESLVVLAVLQSFCAYIVAFYTAKLDQLKEVQKSTAISVSIALLTVVLSLLFVLSTDDDKGIMRIYGQAIPTILFGIVLFIKIYKDGHVTWNSQYNRFCMGLVLPLLVHGIGGLIFNQSDRIMVGKYNGQAMLGIYSVTYSLCNVVTIIKDALNVAWVPFYMDYKKQDDKESIILHSNRYIKLFTILTIGFMLLSFDVFKLMAPEDYWSGMSIIPIFVMGIYCDYLYLFPVNFEFYHCRTRLIPLATFAAAIINVGLNFLLIPSFNIVGAAVATAIAQLINFLLHYIGAKFVINKDFEYPIRFFLKRMLIIVIATIIIVLIKDFWAIRWILAIVLGIYMLRDIIIHRSIF